MFTLLPALLPGFPTPVDAADAVLTSFRPSQLGEYLEALWGGGPTPNLLASLGVPAASAAAFQAMGRPARLDPLPPALGAPPHAPPAVWRHLVYAYMLENTRMVDIFRRVVFEWVHGERLPKPSLATQQWIQTTEQLFFSEPWGYSARAVTSRIRPDSAAVRRNAYYRLLGMDLNHGADDGRSYPYVKADAANRDFAALFEALLTEVWKGYANQFNFIGANETDDNAIMTLVRRLQEMLMARRFQGTLSREEFDADALLSWLHLTVMFDTAIVRDLSAEATGQADRLRIIGDRVGLPAHARCDSYFQLAIPMSAVLTAIQIGAVALASDLYATTGPLTAQMLEIITHWSIATGRNMKDPTVRQPLGTVIGRLQPAASAAPAPAPTGNGSRISALRS